MARFGLGKLAVVLAIVSSGCASHGTVHVAQDESRPHISWEIRSGGNEGDNDFVCGSSQPAKPCVLTASAGNRSTFAVAHLSVHAAAKPTAYVGSMRPAFFEGSPDRKAGEINARLEPGQRPVATSVLGRVTPKPGSYTFTIIADAMPSGATSPLSLSQEIPVVVK